MRFRSLVIWVVVIAFLAWAGSTIVFASSVYMETSGLVDRAVTDALRRRKAQLAAGMSQEVTRDFIPSIRGAIWEGAKRQGLALDPETPIVSEEGYSVRVTVKWSYPVHLYSDQMLFNLPMSITRIYTSS